MLRIAAERYHNGTRSHYNEMLPASKYDSHEAAKAWQKLVHPALIPAALLGKPGVIGIRTPVHFRRCRIVTD